MEVRSPQYGSGAWPAVEANGGRIELESEEEKGSLFRVVLPLAAEDRAVA
jgi:signal transduction histidine kinase